jgi:hypothetical protein
MAEKIIIDIDLNYKDAIDKLSKLDKSIINVTDSITNLSASFEDVYGELKPLTARAGELEDRLYELTQAGETTTKEFKELTKEVGRLKKEQQDFDLIIDRSSKNLNEKFSTAISTATGGIVLAEGAMSALGIQGSTAEESMAKMVQAIDIGKALKSINESTGMFTKLGSAIKKTTLFQKASTAAQYLWNLALSANPIGIVVIAVTALIAAGYGLIKLFDFMTSKTIDNSKALADNAKALDNQSESNQKARDQSKNSTDQQVAMAKAQGKSTIEIRKLEKAIVQKTVTDAEATKAIAKKTLATELDTLANEKARDATEEEIKLAQENVSKARKNLEVETKNLEVALKSRIDLKNRFLVEDAQAETNARNKDIESRKSASQKAADVSKAEEEKQANEKKENDAKLKQEDKEYWEGEAEEQLKAVVEKAEALEEIRKAEIDTEAERRAEELLQRKEQLLQVKLQYDLLVEKAILYNQSTDELKKAQRVKELELQAGFDEQDKKKADDLIKKEIELEEKKKATKLKALDDLQMIFGAETAMGRAALIGKQLLAAKELLIDLGAIKSKASKAIITANIEAASSGSAVSSGFAQTLKLGFPAAIPALIGYAATAVGIISSVLAATKKTKSVASSFSGGGGGGGSITSAPAVSQPPAFNVVGASNTNQLADAIGGQSKEPVKAYVVSNDVTSAQSMDRNIVNGASI